MKVTNIDESVWKVLNNYLSRQNAIARIVGEFPFNNTDPSGHGYIVYRNGFNFAVCLESLSSLLPQQWLSTSAIMGLAAQMPAYPGVQLLHSDILFSLHYGLSRGRSLADIQFPTIGNDIDTIVAPVNFTGNHWFTIECTIVNRVFVITVYNSIVGSSEDILQSYSQSIFGLIKSHTASPLWHRPTTGIRIDRGTCTIQKDSYSCGIVTIENLRARLVRQQPPKTNRLNANILRRSYAVEFASIRG